MLEKHFRVVKTNFRLLEANLTLLKANFKVLKLKKAKILIVLFVSQVISSFNGRPRRQNFAQNESKNSKIYLKPQ